MKNLDDLTKMLNCHSTPGDEAEMAHLLQHCWHDAGWKVQAHGQYAISARRPDFVPERPTLLVCAHMDSPGFTVEKLEKDRAWLIPLGNPHFEDDRVSAILKTSAGKINVPMEATSTDENGKDRQYYIPRLADMEYGDRVCYAGAPSIAEGKELITSPFLDNRLGCFILSALARELNHRDLELNFVLGATACEEMGGFGAPVLARAVQPDLVICLDATYEDNEQDVVMGNGPVLTLSDASVILSPRMRDRIKTVFAKFAIPLQTEVYNFSGTDSRAFPHQGLCAPVLALLIATQGNHTPAERASLTDIETTTRAVKTIATHGVSEALLSPTFAASTGLKR